METLYLCHFNCGYENNDKEFVKNHESIKHGYQCKFCKFADISLEVYERHLKYVHDKPLLLSCKVCNESIDGLNEMEKHLEFSHNTNHWTLSLGLRELNRKIEDMK